jgi:hypothetical protein
LILDELGTLKGAYTYAGAPMLQSSMTRNILLGHLSGIFTAILQTDLASGNGYKLFSFTFLASSSTPTFKWGFDSSYKTTDDKGFSIIFASSIQYFYAYGRQNGQNLIGLFKTSNGA